MYWLLHQYKSHCFQKGQETTCCRSFHLLSLSLGLEEATPGAVRADLQKAQYWSDPGKKPSARPCFKCPSGRAVLSGEQEETFAFSKKEPTCIHFFSGVNVHSPPFLCWNVLMHLHSSPTMWRFKQYVDYILMILVFE